jgi:hypothetical protein
VFEAMTLRKLLLWSPLILFLGIIVTVLLVNLGWLGNNSASLNMINKSGVEINEITVTIHDTPCLVKRLGPGASGSCVFPIESDSHFSISWVESGTTGYSEQAGYVTPGFDFIYQLDFLGEGKIGFELDESS